MELFLKTREAPTHFAVAVVVAVVAFSYISLLNQPLHNLVQWLQNWQMCESESANFQKL